jgi:hypothetical protein
MNVDTLVFQGSPHFYVTHPPRPVPEVHVGGVMKPETHIFLFGLETIDTSRNLI